VCGRHDFFDVKFVVRSEVRRAKRPLRDENRPRQTSRKRISFDRFARFASNATAQDAFLGAVAKFFFTAWLTHSRRCFGAIKFD